MYCRMLDAAESDAKTLLGALEHLGPVEETTDLSIASYARRVGVRADSTLAAISDEDFERG